MHAVMTALLLTIPAPSSATAPSSLTLRIHARDAYTCVYCGITDVPLAVDHVTPCAHFPATALTSVVNDPRNLVTACGGCNGAKGPQDLAGFARMLRGRGILAADVTAVLRRVRAATRRRLP